MHLNNSDTNPHLGGIAIIINKRVKKMKLQVSSQYIRDNNTFIKVIQHQDYREIYSHMYISF